MTLPATNDPTMLLGLVIVGVIIAALVIWTIKSGTEPYDNDH